MIDLVTGYAQGYHASFVRPFLKTLRETGYTGHILLFADSGGAKEATRWDAEVLPCPSSQLPLCSARFLTFRDALRGRSYDGVLLTDTRDVIFQRNAADYLPDVGVNAFEEDDKMTIGSCPYNAKWIREGYGENALDSLRGVSIVCAGTVCGDFDSMMVYIGKMCKEIEHIQSSTSTPLDQAAHNVLVHGSADIVQWENERSEVFNVGYIMPRETVCIVEDNIINKVGNIPAVIHQWDRHQNLTKLVERKYV